MWANHMAISLTNKRNTKIEETLADHPTRNTKVVAAAKLFHHGSNTCTVAHLRDPQTGHVYRRTVDIDLCGWDTVTTRGKINKFLRTQGIQAGLARINGTTRVQLGWDGRSKAVSDVIKLAAGLVFGCLVIAVIIYSAFQIS